jgi:TetR/AcrR family transcriptional regulator, transcriptional repressor for nem operon
MLRIDGWQASSSGRGPSGAVREAEEARAGGGARIIETAARPGKTVSAARAIAALMAEAGLARGHRTAAGLPSGRPDGRNGLRSYYHCRRVSADGKWFLRRVEERVARYGTEHKQATRRRIIETAGRRLKRDGIDGSGVATLMADAGLTNGAFYAHFASKEDLVAAAVAGQLREQRESLSAVAPGRAGVEQYVRAYLSAGHRDNPADGCPSAALLDEIGRCADATRRAYTDGLLAVIDDVAARLAPHDPPSARVKTLSAFALMAGTLQLSRALADRQLADEVLDQGIQNALALLDAGQRR